MKKLFSILTIYLLTTIAVSATVQVSGTKLGGSFYNVMATNANNSINVSNLVVNGEDIHSKPFVPLYVPQSLDLSIIDSSLKGFAGGFQDGKYAYFIPSSFSKLARIDLNNFTTNGVSFIDLSLIDAGFKGFSGGFTDGKYGYLIPNNNGSYFGKIVRIDLQNFTTNGVTNLNLAAYDSSLIGMQRGFTDGRYGYIMSYYNGSSWFGKIVRIDLLNFSTGGVTILNTSNFDSSLTGFNGGFTDGKYGYAMPYYNNQPNYYGKVTRFSLSDFTTNGLATLDLSLLDSRLKGFIDGFCDGKYGYYISHRSSIYNGIVARVDLNNFTTNGVSILDLSSFDSTLKGFVGNFINGHYGYCVPYNDGSVNIGKLVRFDLNNFTTNGISVIDLSSNNIALKGFVGGFTDGKYGYNVPNASSVVARVQLIYGGN